MKLKEIWAIRIRLQLAKRTRDLVLFKVAINSKSSGCDRVAVHVCNVMQGSRNVPRAIIIQQQTRRPATEISTNE
ncbi:MAG: hypothetical protein V4568_14325 [Pseudomonadota bacterium]